MWVREREKGGREREGKRDAAFVGAVLCCGPPLCARGHTQLSCLGLSGSSLAADSIVGIICLAWTWMYRYMSALCI